MKSTFEMPDVFAVHTQRYPKGHPSRPDGLIMEFADAPYRDEYVIRPMTLRHDIEKRMHYENAEAKIHEYNAVFLRLMAHGTHMPHWYVVGEKPEELYVVAERIKPVEYTDIGSEVVMTEAQQAIASMVSYIRNSPEGSRTLTDSVSYKQFVFGTSTTDARPHFYMVDMDAYTMPSSTHVTERLKEEVCNFAFYVAARAECHELPMYAVRQMPGTEYMLDEICQ